jgi:hypothetical protein
MDQVKKHFANLPIINIINKVIKKQIKGSNLFSQYSTPNLKYKLQMKQIPFALKVGIEIP